MVDSGRVQGNKFLNETAFLTIVSAVFVAELTDKDALLLLTLATRMKARFVFAAGSVAFTITTAIIVTCGYFLVDLVPVSWLKIAGGMIMITYGVWAFLTSEKASEKDERELEAEEDRLLARSKGKATWLAFFSVVSMLALLDLSGDATEILTFVLVAHFQNALMVFAGALIALIAASAFETFLGGQLRKVISLRRIRVLSFVVFLLVGSFVIITTII